MSSQFKRTHRRALSLTAGLFVLGYGSTVVAQAPPPPPSPLRATPIQPTAPTQLPAPPPNPSRAAPITTPTQPQAAQASAPKSVQLPPVQSVPMPAQILPISQPWPGDGSANNAPPSNGSTSPIESGLYSPLPAVLNAVPTYSPRAIADYAPPGLERRPPQSGAAYPLYTPLEEARPVITKDEQGKFVTEGIFPGTYLIPRTKTSLKLYGFARLDGIFDFNPIGSTDDFVTATIPVPEGRGQNFVLTPRYSRIGIKSYTPTSINDWIVQTKIEMDFFNGNTSGGFGSFPIRLRFAYADWGYFRFGQDASVFMDYDVFPNVLDYEGPPGMVLMRQPVLRVTLPIGNQAHWAMALEQPFSDITPSPDGQRIQDLPDFTTHFRYDSGLGHLQVSGVLRKLTNQPDVGDDQSRFGWGVNLTGDYHPWAACMGVNPARKDNPNGLERSRVLGQYAYGYGVNRYIQDVNGFGLDAAAGPGGLFRPIYATGWFGGYEHWWTESWSSTLLYGESLSFLSADFNLPGNTYKGAQYMAANLVWVPISNMMIGAEYLWGSRKNLDGDEGYARRLQFALQYNF